jgi:hypothetical protein
MFRHRQLAQLAIRTVKRLGLQGFTRSLACGRRQRIA